MYGRYIWNVYKRDLFVWSSLRNDGWINGSNWIFNQSEGINGSDSCNFQRVAAAFFALLVMLNLCGAMCCEFCDNVRDILRFPVMERFCASAKWAAGKLDVSFLMSNDGAGFKAWAARDMPNAIQLKYFQHIGRKLFGSILLIFWIKLIQTLNCLDH